MGMGLCCCGDDDPPPPSSGGSVSSGSIPPALCAPCGTNPQTYVPSIVTLTSTLYDGGESWQSPTFKGANNCCDQEYGPPVAFMRNNSTIVLTKRGAANDLFGICYWRSDCDSLTSYTSFVGAVCDGQPATIKERYCASNTVLPNPRNYFLTCAISSGGITAWFATTGHTGTPPVPNECTEENKTTALQGGSWYAIKQSETYSCNPFFYSARWWWVNIGGCCIRRSATEGDCCRLPQGNDYYGFDVVLS